jgi:hypothetical protein
VVNDELGALLDERAIPRVLLSYCRTIDRLDIELLRFTGLPIAPIASQVRDQRAGIGDAAQQVVEVGASAGAE